MEPASDFDLIAASLRANASDTAGFIEALAIKLEASLPGLVRVEREGGLFKREHRVKAIRIQLEESVYEVYRAAGGLEARLSQQVRGIVLKHETLHLDAWIDELSRHLARHAETSAEVRAALERLLT